VDLGFLKPIKSGRGEYVDWRLRYVGNPPRKRMQLALSTKLRLRWQTPATTSCCAYRWFS